MEPCPILKVGTIIEGTYPIKNQIVPVGGYLLEDWGFEREGLPIAISLVMIQYKDAHDIFGYDIFELMDIVEKNK
jgi:hypothetical protein